MPNPAFPDVDPIQFDGSGGGGDLSFKHYDATAIVEGTPMRDHLRFAACYWHTMRGGLGDPFGDPTAEMPWDDGSDSIENAQRRVGVFFEFLQKCSIDFFCFHDRDLIGEGATIAESEERLDAVVETIAAEMERTGKKLLWGTANLFSHRRYMHGAATSPDVDVYAHAGAQVRKAMEVAHRLGGGGYVFWGGREGYTTLLNTNMKRERDQLASFLHMAVAQKASMGFTGQLYIEPKPMEPTTHQYDSDAAACLNFLREFDLLDDFMLNVETNHATMAGHTMAHELAVATAAGHLGSIDANVGTPQVGWDTDRFPTDLVGATNIMLAVLGMGGFTTGGLNFDAKRRRESFEPVDIFHGHIAGMDTFARGLKIAAAIRADGRIQEFLDDRYVSWETPLGAKIMTGGCSLEELASHAATGGEPKMRSGRQELLEAIFNEHL